MGYIITFGAGVICGWWIANKIRDGKNPIQEIQDLFTSFLGIFGKKNDESKK